MTTGHETATFFPMTSADNDQPFRSIRTKFTIAVIGTIFLFLITLLLVSYRLLKENALTGAEELNSTIINKTNKQIDNFFREIERLTRSFARYEAFYTVDVPGMRQLIITTVEERQDYLRAIYLGTYNGQMFEWGIGEGFVDYIPVFLPEDYDPRVRPWYQTATDTKDFAITPPYVYASVEALGITGVMPVYSPDGSFIGVLGTDILLKDLKKMVEQLDIQKQGKVVLLNKDNKAIVNQFIPEPTHESTITLNEFTQFDLKAMSDGEQGNFIAHTSGERFFVSYKKNITTGWTLVVALPYEEVMEFTTVNVQFIIFIEIILVTLLSVLLGMFSSRLMLSPLRELTGVIQSIKKGDNNARVAIDTNDEFGVLSREFNHMLDQINSYSRHIEEKVREKTAQLEKLQQENIRLRVIEEKERIYGYLHDSLGARLTNIFISTSVAKTRADTENQTLMEMFDRIEDNTQKGIEDLKEILFGTEIPERSIIDFNRIVSRNIRERLELKNIGFSYSMSHPEDLNNLSRDLRFEIEKILQELVTNVLKHAASDKVELSLTMSNGKVDLRFYDNGKGFDPDSRENQGFGLTHIRTRIESRGGMLSIRSETGKGTTISISIPTEQKEHYD